MAKKLVTVTFDVLISDGEIDAKKDVTNDEIKQFIRFELGDLGFMDSDNPLEGYEIRNFQTEIDSITITER